MNNQTKPDSAAPGGDVSEDYKKGWFDGSSETIRLLHADGNLTEATERHIEVLRAVGSAFDGIPSPCEERDAIAAAIAALSAPKQVGAGRHALALFRRAKEWIASDSYDGIDARGRALLEEADEAAKVALSAPQPVEAEGLEAVAYRYKFRAFKGSIWPNWDYCSASYFDDVVRNYPGIKHGLGDARFDPLYLSPPPEQPAIDLEQFRPAVMAYKFKAECDSREGYDRVGVEFIQQAHQRVKEADRLLAIIDGAKENNV